MKHIHILILCTVLYSKLIFCTVGFSCFCVVKPLNFYRDQTKDMRKHVTLSEELYLLGNFINYRKLEFIYLGISAKAQNDHFFKLTIYEYIKDS